MKKNIINLLFGSLVLITPTNLYALEQPIKESIQPYIESILAHYNQYQTKPFFHEKLKELQMKICIDITAYEISEKVLNYENDKQPISCESYQLIINNLPEDSLDKKTNKHLKKRFEDCLKMKTIFIESQTH